MQISVRHFFSIVSRYEDCGCRIVNFFGNIYSSKETGLWRGKMSSTWDTSGKHDVSKSFDRHAGTSCSTKAGETAPWILLDTGKQRSIDAVNLFTTNKNAYKMANVQVSRGAGGARLDFCRCESPRRGRG